MDETNEENVQVEENKSNSTFLVATIIIVVVALLAGFVYFSQTRNDEVGPAVTEQTVQENVVESPQVTLAEEVEGTETESDSIQVEVEGGTYYFEPNEIRVKRGQTVKIVFTNANGMHDFVIDELDVRTDITNTGETVEVEFVADEVGEFEYYCSVSNHKQLGMVGTLIVE